MANSEDAPYEQSRAALRRIYGSRRIDASAPPSAQDTTPSARNRTALMATGGNVKFADAMEEATFQQKFQPRPASFTQPMGRPTAWDRLSSTPVGTPEYISRFQDYFSPSGGVTPGFFKTPYGTAEVTAPGQTPITPLAFNLSTPSPLNAASIAPYAPQPLTSYTPPWKRQQATPSFMDTVLNGASKWLS